MERLRGRVALVTGASRGGGKGIALALGKEGATVYVTGRSVRGGQGIAIRCDHSNDAQVDAVFNRIAVLGQALGRNVGLASPFR